MHHTEQQKPVKTPTSIIAGGHSNIRKLQLWAPEQMHIYTTDNVKFDKAFLL